MDSKTIEPHHVPVVSSNVISRSDKIMPSKSLSSSCSRSGTLTTSRLPVLVISETSPLVQNACVPRPLDNLLDAGASSKTRLPTRQTNSSASSSFKAPHKPLPVLPTVYRPIVEPLNLPQSSGSISNTSDLSKSRLPVLPSVQIETPKTNMPSSTTPFSVEALTEIMIEMSMKVDLIYDTMYHKNATARKVSIKIFFDEAGLINFNERLKSDSIFMLNTAQKLIFYVTSAKDIEGRLNLVLEVMFDRKFLSTCSWSEKSSVGARKIDFNRFIYVLHLLRVVGGNDYLEATDTLVKKFLMKKLGNALTASEAKKTKNRRIAVILFYC
ncbi:uncharacterized protein LOC133393259 [Anopheles gambiae]|nr:uncharacterized protein LOC133393259 [Anopheles gambiae]